MKKKEKKKASIDIGEINKRTKRQIFMILLTGMILLAADFMISADGAIETTETYGQLYLIRPEAGENAGYITLQAEIKGEDQSYEKKINVMLEPYEKNGTEQKDTGSEERMTMSEQERLDYELRVVADSFNSDSSARRIRLPGSLDSGEEISWTIEKEAQTNTLTILALMMVISFAVYRNRMAPVRKRQRENMESVIRQLPEFVNRLVLLLNAGLVLSSAFERSVEESMNFQDGSGDYFHEKMKEIYLSVKTANGSMNRELRRFARESGSRELMRISNIISDNINKGVELTQKLQNESELLWMNRKKICEEKGRLAETKLTLPLVIFLMALIVITVAPALLEL